MAGSFIEVTVTNPKQGQRLFSQLIKAGKHLEPAFAEIGEYR